ncbi:MAG: CpsB/CapC family capsule biosynthesis tyrosine phosphatase [Bacillota bacterium]|nr:CpsB/CapC family capsule biosynthesis tyrosine phosphatase [Bacillota bacterium]
MSKSFYIDFHTHLLPGLDDGSKNAAHSARMLQNAADQRTETVICTPHFLPLRETAEEFLNKRENALRSLKSELSFGKLSEAAPKILCGAECSYIKSISRYPGLEKLCIEGTSWLLLELPYDDWDDGIFEEIYLLAVERGVFCIVAHVERFHSQIKKCGGIEAFNELDCVFQLNADSFSFLSDRKKCLSFISGTVPCVLGSDMHSCDIGSPAGSAERWLNEQQVKKIYRVSREILLNAPPECVKETWLDTELGLVSAKQ